MRVFVPLIESMFFNVPIVAFNSSAIADTLGGAGVLFTEKNFPLVAELIGEITANNQLKESIISKQNSWLEYFSEQNIGELLSLKIKK